MYSILLLLSNDDDDDDDDGFAQKVDKALWYLQMDSNTDEFGNLCPV